MTQLFIDLDGVLADMDGFYETHFGVRLNRAMPYGEPPDLWENVRSIDRWFEQLPLMPDALELWEGACKLHPAPAILTGIPKSMPQAAAHKAAWVARHLGAHVPVFTCHSKDKRLFGKPGDILVDDWDRYLPLWERMGGIFVLHTSARDSLAKLATLLNPRLTHFTLDVTNFPS